MSSFVAVLKSMLKLNYFSMKDFQYILTALILSILPVTNGQTANNSTVIGKFTQEDITFSASQVGKVNLTFYGSATEDINISFNFTVLNVLQKIPNVLLKAGHNESITVELHPITYGHTVLYANATPSNMIDLSDAYVRVSVSHSDSWDNVSNVVGWLYFIAWSISFYPQTILNFKRKSVIGLHFDFLALNIVGFLYYSLFNISLYWIPLIQAQYFQHHPFGVNPVQLNDVIFAVHAFFACLIQVLQCLMYDRGDQKVSRVAKVILGIIALCSFTMAMLGGTSVFQWLDVLYFVSFVKLFITLIKYIPQAFYNYRRKSTSGWSIGNVLLDFTGGTLSIAQMFIIAYNYNDWSSIFGDPTKFGLGLFSMVFDVLFIVQHYVLYRNGRAVVPIQHSPEQSLRDTAPLVSDSVSSYGSVVR